ncbi:MAG: hypothetical protein CSA94_00250 [Bacteroidetes bacterium]|nr:MAG: hypothetical protein CSA94_00250 [Bacteroidota bacterium]
MRKIYILLVFIFCWQIPISYAGHESRSHGGRSAAMGFADVGLKDFWALRNNQAGLAYITQISGGIYYENRYLIPEMGFQSIGIAIPVKNSVIGITADYFGDENFNETTIGLAFAKQLFKNFSMGIQMDYLTTFVDNDSFGRHHLLTFELALMYELTEGITIGFHTYNPFETKLNKDAQEIIPATYSLGGAFHINDNLRISSEIEKVTDRDESFKMGVEYKVAKKTWVRAGVGTRPGIFSFGFETAWKNIVFQFASSKHPTLGYSPMASLIVGF